MAELDVGKHCSLASCKQLDFLPFVCDACKLVFCKEHCVKEQHSCSKEHLKATDKSSSTPYEKYSCSMKRCCKTELVPVICEKCHLNHCMLHRHAADHSCGQPVEDPNYMTATAQHVQKIVESKAQLQTKRKTPKSKKAIEMAAKVALMKIKQMASGDTGIPQESRVYVGVLLPNSTDAANSAQQKQSPYWLDQEWTVGKSVDYISIKSRIRNNNNKTGSLKLRLCSTVTDDVYNAESKLRDLIAGGELYSGSTVELRYISEDSNT